MNQTNKDIPQVTKALPKQQLVNVVRAIPDNIVYITFLAHNKQVIIAGKTINTTMNSVI